MKKARDRHRHRNGTGMGVWPWSARQWYWFVVYLVGPIRYAVRCKNKGEVQRTAKAEAKRPDTSDVRVVYTCAIVKP